MSDSSPPKQVIGEVVWRDLTAPNAVEVRDFYRAVLGLWAD